MDISETEMLVYSGKPEGLARAAHNEFIMKQDLDVNRRIRAGLLEQKPMTLWFTGLSGAGKSTIANALEKRLVGMGRHTMLLDGDNIRLGLCSDLGFSKEGRDENIRRIAEVARLMNDAGLIVLCSFISPSVKERENARSIIGDCFMEVYISTPLEVCEARDVKGLYKKARTGEIKQFTGVSSAYEAPVNPDLVIDTTGQTVEQSVDAIIKQLWGTITLRNLSGTVR